MWATLTLLAAALVVLAGFALLALSQERHWEAVFTSGTPHPHRHRRARRGLGFALIALGLVVCIAGEGPGFGSVLWMVLISLDAAAIALTLAWKPHWLRWTLLLRRHSTAGS